MRTDFRAAHKTWLTNSSFAPHRPPPPSHVVFAARTSKPSPPPHAHIGHRQECMSYGQLAPWHGRHPTCNVVRPKGPYGCVVIQANSSGDCPNGRSALILPSYFSRQRVQACGRGAGRLSGDARRGGDAEGTRWQAGGARGWAERALTSRQRPWAHLRLEQRIICDNGGSLESARRMHA